VQITEVRIKLMENSEDRLRGFCSVTFDDCFVIRDLKIIEGKNGPFVAMPSRKLTTNCFKCRTKNHLRARYCNHCGTKQKVDNVVHNSDGRARLYADIAHPVNAECREMIQSRVIEEFLSELGRAKEPGYVSRYDDEYSSTPTKPEIKPANNDNGKSENQRTDAGTSNPVSGTHGQGQSPESTTSKPSDQNQSDSGNFGKGILD